MNDKLSATHAKWRDGVLAHNIINIQHIPGVTNIADGLSCQYKNTPKSGNDGSEWDVDSYWKTGAGLVFGVNYISIPPATQSLQDHFANTLLFRDVIDTLEGIQSRLGLWERKRARHWATRYMIEGDKLWYVGGGTGTQAVACRECVTKEEAAELTKAEHEKVDISIMTSSKLPSLTKYTPQISTNPASKLSQTAQGVKLQRHPLTRPLTTHNTNTPIQTPHWRLPLHATWKGRVSYSQLIPRHNTFTQHIWGYKFKTAGTGKTTVKALDNIYSRFTPEEVFMSVWVDDTTL